MNSDLADDFVVPAGYAWVVRWIDVDGAYFNGPGPANSFRVSFYADNDGFPGNQVYATFALSWEQNGSTFRVYICYGNDICFYLYPGRYWVEIQAHMTATCCGEWGWTDRTVTSLNPAVWRNPSGFFGACTNWSRRGATCALDPSAPDQVYRIYASVTYAPTPTPTLTPQPTPTPSEAPCAGFPKPDCNSTVFTQLTAFYVYVSGFVGSLPPPSVFTVNGIPADTVSGGGSTLEFFFNVSPVMPGQNTMDIPPGAFTCSNSGRPFEGLHCTFTYQPPTPTPRVAPTARVRPTPPPRR